MTGKELVLALRESRLDDVAPPYLWPDAELLRYLNYAEVQACRRAQLIIDWTTASDAGTAATAGTAGQKPLCSLNIIANQATYALSPKILQIRRCQIKSMTYPLIGPVTYSEIDSVLPGWWGTAGTVITSGSGGATTTVITAGTSSTGTSATSGTTITQLVGGYPTYFVNEPANTITFVLSPSADDVAHLIVSRIPLTPFTLLTSPEIEEKYHEGLVDWAAHLAFMKPDSETINLKLATLYEAKFEGQFGPLPNAFSEKIRKTIPMMARMRPRPWGS